MSGVREGLPAAIYWLEWVEMVHEKIRPHAGLEPMAQALHTTTLPRLFTPIQPISTHFNPLQLVDGCLQPFLYTTHMHPYGLFLNHLFDI